MNLFEAVAFVAFLLVFGMVLHSGVQDSAQVSQDQNARQAQEFFRNAELGHE